MSARRTDPRGAVAVVRQWPHEVGPSVHFFEGHGRTPAERERAALRSAVYCEAEMTTRSVHRAVPTGVFVQERGQWVPA